MLSKFQNLKHGTKLEVLPDSKKEVKSNNYFLFTWPPEQLKTSQVAASRSWPIRAECEAGIKETGPKTAFFKLRLHEEPV